jgi:hypothetical protein
VTKTKRVLFTEVVVNPGPKGSLWSCEQGMTMGRWYQVLTDKGVVVDHLKPFGLGQ